MPFPFIPVRQGYWDTLSNFKIFSGKEAKDLQRQTEFLLDKLLSLSTPTNFQHEPSSYFSPLQNVCLFSRAFGIERGPLAAFWPRDTTGLCHIMEESGVFLGSMTPRSRDIALWDDHSRKLLPIDCKRDRPVRKSNLQEYQADLLRY